MTGYPQTHSSQNSFISAHISIIRASHVANPKVNREEYTTYQEKTNNRKWQTNHQSNNQSFLNVDSTHYCQSTTTTVSLSLDPQVCRLQAFTNELLSGPITSWEIHGETVGTVSDFILGEGGPKSLQMVIAAMKVKDAYSLEGKLWPNWIAYLKAETLLCQQRSV